MPIYLLTLHAYCSWMPDHERGYTKRNVGVLPPDPEMAQNYARKANWEPIAFTEEHGRIIAGAIKSVCEKHKWRLHCCVTVETHVHLLLSWKDDQLNVDVVYTKLKQSTGFALAQHFGTKGRPYFSKGGGDDRKLVNDDDHFEYLMTKYLPDHHGYTINERSRGL